MRLSHKLVATSSIAVLALIVSITKGGAQAPPLFQPGTGLIDDFTRSGGRFLDAPRIMSIDLSAGVRRAPSVRVIFSWAPMILSV